jgi:hypothetical protein
MEIRLKSLATEKPQEFCLEAREWSRVLKILKARKLVDDETLARLESSPSGVQIGDKAAGELGLRYLISSRKTLPTPAIDVGPMAMLNGVWIDPVLALQQPYKEKAERNTQFLLFCVSSRGFSVS